MKVVIAIAVTLFGLVAYIAYKAADLHTALGWLEVTAVFLAFVLLVLLVRITAEQWHNRDK